jgi:hypothetical protein
VLPGGRAGHKELERRSRAHGRRTQRQELPPQVRLAQGRTAWAASCARWRTNQGPAMTRRDQCPAPRAAHGLLVSAPRTALFGATAVVIMLSRWHNQLDPSVNKTPFTEWEQAVIFKVGARSGLATRAHHPRRHFYGATAPHAAAILRPTNRLAPTAPLPLGAPPTGPNQRQLRKPLGRDRAHAAGAH